MLLALRFWRNVLLWGGGLTFLLIGVSLLAGQAPTEVLVHLPTWVGLALAIAAFPAGAMVSAEVLIESGLRLRPVLFGCLAALSVSVAMFALGNLVAPAIQRSLVARVSADEAIAEAVTMSLAELGAAASAAEARARSESGAASIRQGQLANQLVWHYVRRTDGALLPFLLGMLGVVAGFWSRRARRAELRQAQLWAMALFLLVSTYLVGENSYELLVLRSAGPVYFAGDLVLVVPLLLLLGIGWPTLLSLLQPVVRSEAP